MARHALVVVTTTVETYPTSATALYACNPVILTGAETEGSAPTFSADGNTILYAANLGTMIPPAGTYLVVHGGSGRLAFRYDG